MVIDVTEIYDEIVGHAGVCYPSQDKDGRFILSETTLQDCLLSQIRELINECPRIPHNPKKVQI